MTPSTKIHLGCAAFLAVLSSAFLLPRLAAGGDKGLAGAAAAAITVVAIGFAAFVLATVLAVMTYRARATLPFAAKISGLVPLPLLLASVAVAAVLVSSAQKDGGQADPPTRATTTTEPPANP